MSLNSPVSSLTLISRLLIVSAVATTAALAQPMVTCSTSTPTSATIRNEGHTEQVGDYVFQCTNYASQTSAATITATIGSPVSNTITSKVVNSSNGQTEAAVQVFYPAPIGGHSSTITYLGTVSGSVVTFNVPIPESVNTSSDQPYTFTITNIRIDATGNTPGDVINETVSVSGTGITGGNFTAAQVAMVEQGLGAQSVTGAGVLPVCSSFSAANPLFTVNFGEGGLTPTAFKTQGGSGNTTLGSWFANNTETGYYISTALSGSVDNTANSGTRVRVQFSNIPANLAVYVPTTLSSAQTLPSGGPAGTLTLTASESGAFSAVSPSSNPTGYSGGTPLALLTVTGGTAEAVYEVTGDDPTQTETYAAAVYAIATGALTAQAPAMTAAVSFAPVGATSNIPNFAQLSDTTVLSGTQFPACLMITNSVLGNGKGVLGISYSQAVGVSGGILNYTWSLMTGSLPPGLSLNAATGAIAGTPSGTTAGTYTFTIMVADSGGQTAAQQYSIQIVPAVYVSGASTPTGAQGESYTGSFSALDGFGSYTWSIVSGSLPNGIALNTSTGALSGTISATATTGAYPFTIQVLDSSGSSAQQMESITINSALSITSTSPLTTVVQGVGVNYTVTPSGGTGGYTWSITSGLAALNALGISFSSGGLFTGTPTGTTSTPLNLTIKLADPQTSVSKNFMLSVNAALSIPTPTLPIAVSGTAYSYTIPITTGYLPSNCLVYSGSLGSGITVSTNSTGALLSASTVSTTTSPVTYTFQIRCNDYYSETATSNNQSLTVNPALSVMTTAVPASDQGQAVNYQLQSAGGTGTGLSWTLNGGALPTGVSISSAGVVTGTPTQNGSFTFAPKVTDSNSDTAVGSVTWTVNTAPSITNTVLPAGEQNSPYTATTFAATGGSGTGYTWTSGTLPTGMSLSSAGVLSGTPTVSGNFSVLFTVTDSVGGTGTAPLPFTIDVAGTIITTNLPSNYVIVNTSGTIYGAAGSSGNNQIYWQRPFSTTGGALLEYTIQPGTYSFRVIDPADAQTAFPSLTTAQLNSINTAWTYNSPYTTGTLVFDSSAATNSSENQLFTVADINGLVYTAQAAYNLSISQGDYNAIAVGPRNATPVYSYTFTQPETLIFAVPDYALGDNGGGTSILIAPVAPSPVSISTTSLPSGTVNATYSPFTFTASGGSQIYTWSATGLPTGLSLTSAGVLSGSPVTAGTYTSVKVTVTDTVSGMTASKTYTLTISGTAFSITTMSLPGATEQQAYSTTLAASGGSQVTADYSWSATGLPSFLTLSTAGVLSGTPTTGGTFTNISITAMDTVTGQMANMVYSLTAAYSAPVFNYVTEMDGLAPLGYFRLEATSGTSQVGGYTYTSTGATVETGAPIGVTGNQALLLNGATGGVSTTLTGGITSAGTVLAWVNLSELPSTANRILYIAGESQVGNDFDLQLTSDNYLRFYTTASGQNIGYALPTANLVGQWHLVAATFDNTVGKRAVYFDGIQVATDNASSIANKTTSFNIGATPVFSGRNFPGAIDEAAVWNSALTSAQIAEIYASGSAALPPGVITQVYQPVPLYAGGGSGNFTYSATGLPAGLSLSTAGVLSGTPTALGTFTPAVTITDTMTSQSISPTLTLNVTMGLQISPTSLPSGVQNDSYSQTLTASGATGSIVSWTVTSGSLPAGLTLSNSGALTGTLTQAGTSTFTVQVTDSASNTASRQYTLIVNAPLTIMSGSLTGGAVGEGYSGNLNTLASGGAGTYTWGPVLSGSLPYGVILSSTGSLSGTPTTAGNYTFNVQVADQNSDTTTGNVTIAINGPLTIVTTSLTPAPTQGTSYNQSLSASGGVGSYTWAVYSGQLPTGLTLSAAGEISGTPTASGTFNFTVSLTDSGMFTVTQGYSVLVSGGASLSITPTSLTSAVSGTAYSQALSVSGGTTPYTWTITDGTFTQAGLSLNSSTGTITGTPNTVGALSFTVQVTDHNSNSTSASYVLQIAPATPPTNDFAVQNEGSSIVRVSDVASRDGTICASCGTYDIAADSQGNIYAKNQQGIQMISPTGVVTTVLNYGSTDSALSSGGGVGGLALDGLGNLIFVDNNADAVFRVKTDGTQFTEVAPYPVQSPEEFQDTYVAVDSSGNYIVVDDAFSEVAVYKFTPTGSSGTTVLSTPIASSGVSGLVIDSSGNYDYLDYQNNKIVSVTPNGSVSTLFSIPEEQLDFALGLTLERSGNFIMGGDGFNSLFRATPAGAFTAISGDDLVSRVSSIAVIPAASGVITGGPGPGTGPGPLTISPSSLPSGVANQSYGPVTLGASGGSGSYSWASSSLPSGITLSGSTISGLPTSAGSYSVSVTATDSVTGQTGTANYFITITAPVSTIVISQAGAQLSTALGGSIADMFSASGGASPYTFSAGGLPSGVSLNSMTGALSGTPGQASNFTVTVQATDKQGMMGSISIAISVLGFGSSSLPSGVAGRPYSGSITAIGGSGTYTFSATGLPSGLSLNSGGSLTGSVIRAGTYTFSVKVTDSNSLTLTASFSVTFAAPPALTITSSTLPAGSVGTPYGQPLSATGGVAPYQWAKSGGSLPPAMNLTSTGVVSGTPATPGTFSFGVMVTDSSGAVRTASVSLTIQPAPLTITTASPLPSGIAGIDYPMQVFTASGGTGAYTWSITSGTLPGGIAFSSGGTLSGNTASTGAFPFTVTVTDAASAKATASYSLNMRAPVGADLIISTGSVSFTLNSPATSVPTPQNIGVQSSQATTQLSYSLAVSPATPWLSLQNGNLTPDSIQASLASSALTLSPGTYSTTITLTCTSSSCSGHTQTVSVSLVVSNSPATLSVGTSLLSFGLMSTPPQTASQNITLQNSGGGALLFGSVGCEASWCTVSGVPGTLTGGVSGTITVTVDPVAAGPGFSRTQVDIVSSGGRASVPITVLVAANPTMTLAPVGEQFAMQAGSGPGNPNGSFLVSVVSGASSVAWTASVVSMGTPWLVLNTQSGSSTPNQPGSVSYSIGSAAAMLAPGAYYGQIQVTSSGVVDSPQVYEVVLNVTATASAIAPDPQPQGLLFITTAAATPPPQTVSAYSGSSASLPFQASVTPVSASAWLSVTPSLGTTSQSAPGTVSVTVNPSQLTPGVYMAGVSFSLSATAVRTVNVTVIVTPPTGSQVRGLETPLGVTPKAGSCTPTTLAPTQNGLVNNFSAAVAWPTPLSILLADNCGSTITNGQIVATFSNGDPPLALGLANPSTGLYSGTWTPRSAASQVTIAARASAPGYPNATAQIVGATLPNAAPVLTPHGTLHSFAPVLGAALAPGTIVQIYGQNLASQTTQPTTIPLPTTVNGTSVIIGGVPAPLYYVSPGQINAQLPFELNPNQPYQVLVTVNGAITTPDSVSLTPAVPGFAAFGDGTLIAQHGDGSLVSATSPAHSGEYLVAYLAGMGDTNATPASGAASPSSPLALPTVAPTLTINGAPSPIAFAGLTPGLVGLYQMNFQVPSGLPAGDITIVISQNGVPSNETVLPYTP